MTIFEQEDEWQDFRAECYNFCCNKEKNILESWCKEAGITNPIAYNFDYKKLIIFTDRPGYFIGKAGNLCNKYKEILKNKYHKDIPIEFQEITNIVNINKE